MPTHRSSLGEAEIGENLLVDIRAERLALSIGTDAVTPRYAS